MNPVDQEIRFTVTDGKGKRSATWKCWSQAESGKNDIYLICREMKGAIKTSFHQSGIWRSAFSEEFWEQNFDTFRGHIEDRCLDKWSVLNEIGPGIVLAFFIYIPYLSINIVGEQIRKNIVQVESPPEDETVQISILITKQYTKVSNWPGETSMGTKLIGSMVLANGDIVWIVYKYVDAIKIENLNEEGRKVNPFFFNNYNIVDLRKNNLRALIWGDTKDGTRVIIESTVNNEN